MSNEVKIRARLKIHILSFLSMPNSYLLQETSTLILILSLTLTLTLALSLAEIREMEEISPSLLAAT